MKLSILTANYAPILILFCLLILLQTAVIISKRTTTKPNRRTGSSNNTFILRKSSTRATSPANKLVVTNINKNSRTTLKSTSTKKNAVASKKRPANKLANTTIKKRQRITTTSRIASLSRKQRPPPCNYDDWKCVMERQRNRSIFFDRLFQNYDKRIFPTNETVVVQTAIYINSLNSISEVSFDYELGIYLRLSWLDTRLAFDPNDLDGQRKCDMTTAMDVLWTPDIYITNEKKSTLQTVTTPNRFMLLFSNGVLFFSQRIYATVYCEMNLQTFPFDSQFCQLTFESFAYTERHIVLEWAAMPLEMTPDLAVPQFTITDISFDKFIRLTSRGNISSLFVTFTFARDFGFYILQIYLPSFLIVLTACTAFWIDPLAVPARVTIGVFPTLIMASMLCSLRNQLPLVSYVKAVDVWILACMFFVFLALLEYAGVNILIRQKPKGMMPMSLLQMAAATAPTRLLSIVQRTTAIQAIRQAENSENITISHYDDDDVLKARRSSVAPGNQHWRRRRAMALVTQATIQSQSSDGDDQIYKSGGAHGGGKRRGHYHGQRNSRGSESDDNYGNNKQQDDSGDDDDDDGSTTACCLCLWSEFSNLPGVKRVELLETTCRYVFPLSFLIFNVIYWIMYCYVLQNEDHHGEDESLLEAN